MAASGPARFICRLRDMCSDASRANSSIERETVMADIETTSAATAANESDGDAKAVPTPAEALEELTGTLGRAWTGARGAVGAVGVTLKRHARNVGAETREAATETKDTLGDAVSGIGELGHEVAEDLGEIAKALGVSLRDYVRARPVKSLVIAAIAGAVVGRMLLGRRGRD
jgi:hypothetical protein